MGKIDTRSCILHLLNFVCIAMVFESVSNILLEERRYTLMVGLDIWTIDVNLYIRVVRGKLRP